MRNLAEMLRVRVESTPDQVALVFGETSVSWLELFERASTIARRIQSSHVEPGSVVAICCDHGPSQAVSLFGAALADCVFTLVHPVLKQPQVIHQIVDSDAQVVIATERRARPLADQLGQRPHVWIEVDDLGNAEPSPGVDLSPTAIPADIACLVYTSGSTGRPKGVVVPHSTLLAGARIVSGYLGIRQSDTIVGVLPLGFDYGLNQLLQCVFTGSRYVFTTFTFGADFLGVLEREAITVCAVTPALWPRVLQAGESGERRYDLSSVRLITTAGGPHPVGMLQRISQLFTAADIVVMYGLTEAFRSTWLPPDQVFLRPGSIGKAVPEVEILVVRPDGTPCDVGERGELIHRGALMNYGYLNDPELTDQRYVTRPRLPGCTPETVLRSGDLVSKDSDGYLYFHGRIDRQIKSSGFRVSPSEVEEAVLSVKGIAAAAAFGVADDEVGQRVAVAFVAHGDVDSSIMDTHLRSVLPSYAVPSHYAQVDALPLTPTGKIDYTTLERVVLAEL